LLISGARGLFHGSQAGQHRLKSRLGLTVIFQQLLALCLPVMLPSPEQLIFLLHSSTQGDQRRNFFIKCVELIIGHFNAYAESDMGITIETSHGTVNNARYKTPNKKRRYEHKQ